MSKHPGSAQTVESAPAPKPRAPASGSPATGRACGLEVISLTKRFGDFTAMDQVSMKGRPGSFHALLGENGAGKSTLVKCVVGYQQPDEGSILIADREQQVRSPREASMLGVGMVYQHFTLLPHMTVAEYLIMSLIDTPQFINWRQARV
ncbi:MAG: ATP-binding cassette domain-containing protein [Ectothiorhodospiraceae bacterium]|nr:ATP-binding cassette domain-containing protein [Ectothiorhodospiraceae bacterium]